MLGYIKNAQGQSVLRGTSENVQTSVLLTDWNFLMFSSCSTFDKNAACRRLKSVRSFLEVSLTQCLASSNCSAPGSFSTGLSSCKEHMYFYVCTKSTGPSTQTNSDMSYTVLIIGLSCTLQIVPKICMKWSRSHLQKNLSRQRGLVIRLAVVWCLTRWTAVRQSSQVSLSGHGVFCKDSFE